MDDIAQIAVAEMLTLEASLSTFNNVTQITQNARKAMLDKFLPEVMSLDMRVDKMTDSEQHEAKSRFISEMRGLLNDMDGSAKKHVDTLFKQKDQEIAQANNINAAELLSKIKIGSTIQTAPATESESLIEEKLEQRFKESGAEIPVTELETGNTELPSKKSDNEEL